MVRRRMVRGTVGGFGVLCDEWALTLLELEMEELEKLGRGCGCPYRNSVMQVSVSRECVERERRSVSRAGGVDQVVLATCNTLRP